MSVYYTEQKKILVDFMTENKDRNFTIDEIEQELLSLSKHKQNSNLPAKSTIYRLAASLCDEGVLRKFVHTDSRKATYQLNACGHCDSHLHLKCTDCGKLIHMDENISDKLIRQISSVSDFSINESETVLFGKCSECKRK